MSKDSITLYNYRGGPDKELAVPLVEVNLAHFASRCRPHETIRLIKNRYPKVDARDLYFLLNQEWFLRGFDEFAKNAERIAEDMGVFKTSAAVLAFQKLLSVMERNLEKPGTKNLGKLKVGLEAANSILDRSSLTQKTSRQEVKTEATVHLTDEQMNQMLDAMKESDQYAVNVTPETHAD